MVSGTLRFRKKFAPNAAYQSIFNTSPAIISRLIIVKLISSRKKKYSPQNFGFVGRCNYLFELLNHTPADHGNNGHYQRTEERGPKTGNGKTFHETGQPKNQSVYNQQEKS
jgi:hypothetical protein